MNKNQHVAEKQESRFVSWGVHIHPVAVFGAMLDSIANPLCHSAVAQLVWSGFLNALVHTALAATLPYASRDICEGSVTSHMESPALSDTGQVRQVSVQSLHPG